MLSRRRKEPLLNQLNDHSHAGGQVTGNFGERNIGTLEFVEVNLIKFVALIGMFAQRIGFPGNIRTTEQVVMVLAFADLPEYPVIGAAVFVF